MENKEETMFRIKEVALNKDGTNVWFYPQYLYIRMKTKGVLFWKKEITVERWCNLYRCRDGMYGTGFSVSFNDEDDREYRDKIIGFRDKKEAEDIIKGFSKSLDAYSKEYKENYMKNIGTFVNEEGSFKTHTINT